MFVLRLVILICTKSKPLLRSYQSRRLVIRSTKHTYGSARYSVLSRISGMLSQCPNLKETSSTESASFPIDEQNMIGPVLEHSILSSTFYAGMHTPTSGRLLPL